MELLRAALAIEYGIIGGHTRGGQAHLPFSPSFFALRAELRVDLDAEASESGTGAARFLFMRDDASRVSEYRV